MMAQIINNREEKEMGDVKKPMLKDLINKRRGFDWTKFNY